MPVVLPAHRIERPVRGFAVGEDHPDVSPFVRGVGPDVVVTVLRGRVRPGGLEPRVLVARMVDHEIRDHTDAPPVRLVEQPRDVLDSATFGRHGPVVRDVVAAVSKRRRIERQQPQAVHAEPVQIVEFLDDARDVADAVTVGVVRSSSCNSNS